MSYELSVITASAITRVPQTPAGRLGSWKAHNQAFSNQKTKQLNRLNQPIKL